MLAMPIMTPPFSSRPRHLVIEEIIMKKIIIAVVALAAELFATPFVQAQGTLYVSNLGQTPFGNATVGSDSWLAQPFLTGSNADGYDLNSVQLLMDAASGNPSSLIVSLYSNSSSIQPGNSLGNFSGSDPSTAGIYTYTASSIVLLPSTLYYVVLTAATPIAQGAYNWSVGDIAKSPGGWFIEPDSYSSSDGSNWNRSRSQIFQLGIYATAVPEPSAMSLIFLGSGVLIYARTRNKRHPTKPL
jgi:hypothetical protein